MKKIMLLLTLALFVMVSTMAVDSYTTAIVDSEAKVTITNPNSPILIRAREGLEIRQGESEHALTITNNMNVTVDVTSLEIKHDDLSFSFTSTSIPPKESLLVDLEVDDYCAAVSKLNVPVIFAADFLDGSKNIVGNARIATTIDLEVLEGELDLEITKEKLKVLWNNKSVPDDIKGKIKICYQYHATENEKLCEDNWKPAGDIFVKRLYQSIPGHHYFKACMGDKVVSPVQLIVVEDTSEEEEINTQLEAELEKYFKHEVEGLPESEDDDN